MAKRASPLEDLIAIAAKLPWWINVLLAIVSYGALHVYAGKPAPVAPTEIEQLGAHAVHSMWQGMATFGQYLLPFVFLLAGAASFIARKHRQKLLQRAAESQNGAMEIRGMTWREFEMLIGEMFRMQGYRVNETKEGADGGVDLILHKGAEKYFVQCKRLESAESFRQYCAGVAWCDAFRRCGWRICRDVRQFYP